MKQKEVTPKDKAKIKITCHYTESVNVETVVMDSFRLFVKKELIKACG